MVVIDKLSLLIIDPGTPRVPLAAQIERRCAITQNPCLGEQSLFVHRRTKKRMASAMRGVGRNVAEREGRTKRASTP